MKCPHTIKTRVFFRQCHHSTFDCNGDYFVDPKDSSVFGNDIWVKDFDNLAFPLVLSYSHNHFTDEKKSQRVCQIFSAKIASIEEQLLFATETIESIVNQPVIDYERLRVYSKIYYRIRQENKMPQDEKMKNLVMAALEKELNL